MTAQIYQYVVFGELKGEDGTGETLMPTDVAELPTFIIS